MTLRLRSCELQAPTMDLKVTFHSPAKRRAGTQVRREREGQDSWGDTQQDPAGKRLPEKGLWGRGWSSGKPTKGCSDTRGLATAGSRHRSLPKGKETGGSGLQPGLQRTAAGPEHSAEWSQPLPCPATGGAQPGKEEDRAQSRWAGGARVSQGFSFCRVELHHGLRWL